jgi:fibronectin type 3 domain-containing protein
MTWYLRNSNSPGAPDITFQYGAPGQVPVAGDWDGNGTTTPGVFDPSTATWYLRNSNSGGAPDVAPFTFGLGGWKPVVGHWSGKGADTVGMVDPATGTWYLRGSNSSGAPDIAPFAYGLGAWQPVAGASGSAAGAAGNVHNVVFVATEHDSVYAFDADAPANNGPGGYLWKTSFIDPANRITTVPYQEVNTPDIVPEVGITGTPVIDAATDTLYVVAKTKEIRREGNQDVVHYVQRLHALDTRSGADKAAVTIGDTTFVGGRYNDVTTVAVPGTGAGSVAGIVRFNSLRELQRPGLALDNGNVYVAFASHGDNGPYHGWVVAYSALSSLPGSGLSQRAVFNTSPDGGLDGIWQSGGAPSIDPDGNLIFSTGNGTFDAGLAGPNALGPTGGGLGYGGDYAATPTNPNPGVFYSGIPPVTRSVAVKFDSFKSRPGETTISNSTGVYVNGHEPRNVNLQPGDVYQDLTGTGIDFLAGQPDTPHVFQVVLSYNGLASGQEVLSETLIDQTAASHPTFTRNYYVNLSPYVGGNNAYVGFTAGTGGHNGKMDVLSWTYTNALTGQQITLADRDNLQTNGSASFVGTTAQLTDGGAGPGGQGEAGSVFGKQQVDIRLFTTTFTFQMLPGTVSPPADGLTFTVQNAPGGPNGREVGESVVKLNPNQLQADREMTVTDSFTPFNWRELNIADNDLGSGAVMLLPDAAGSTLHPHLAVETGKTGQIYLVDRDHMGGYTPQGPNGNLQTVVLGGPGVWASPAYWNNLIYYQGSNAPLRAFAIAGAMLSSAPAGEGKDTFPFPGAQPSISAEGNDPASGIAWTVDTHLRGERSDLGPAVLHAYRAVPDPSRPPGDQLQELWESDKFDPYAMQQPPSQRDQAGNAVKFVVPTITNGHVYVGTQYELDVYGLFPPETQQPPVTVVGVTGQALSPTSLRISWQPDPSGLYYRATGFKIYRATNPDLSDATLVNQVGRDVTSFTDTGLRPATTYFYYVVTTNQSGDSTRSVLVGVTTRIAPPDVTVTDVCPNAISLSWTATADDHYGIYRRAPGESGYSLLTTLPSNQTSYTDSGLAFGAYSYFVRAVDRDGDSADSSAVGATVGPVNIDYSGGFPDQPSDLAKNGSASFGGGEVTLTNNTSQAGTVWTTSRVGIRGFTTQFEFQFREGSVPRADGFTFTLQADPRGPQALGPAGGGLGYGPDSPPGSISAASVINSVAIKFDIYPNTSDPSEGDNSTGIFTAGRAPTIRGPDLPPDIPDISINLDGTGVTLNSQSPKMVTLAYDGTALTETILDEGTQQTFTHSYTVDVRRFIGSDTAYAGFTGGTGGLWTIQSIKNWTYAENETNLPPRAPSNLRQTGDPEAGAMLRWNCNNDYTAQGYTVERSTDPNTGFVRVAQIDDPNTNTLTDTPAQAGVYYYRVQSFNAVGASPYSNTATTYYQVPAPPSNLRDPRVTASEVDLVWQINSTDQTGFQVERSTEPATGFQVVAQVDPTQNTYTDNTVAGATAYYYRVEAVKGDYVSTPSNVVRANVSANPLTDHQDIGDVAMPGNASYGEGIYTVQASGDDVFGSADAFHYFYRPLPGDGEIVARVLSVQNTDPFAKAGVMIRESLAADARNAFLLITPNPDNGVRFQRRFDPGGDTTRNFDVGFTAPYWLRLVREGNTFTAYRSADGVDWISLGSVTITMANDVYVGLALTAHNNSALNTSTFDNVLVIGAGAPAPGGGPAVAGAPGDDPAAFLVGPAGTTGGLRLDAGVPAAHSAGQGSARETGALLMMGAPPVPSTPVGDVAGSRLVSAHQQAHRQQALDELFRLPELFPPG